MDLVSSLTTLMGVWLTYQVSNAVNATNAVLPETITEDLIY